MQRFINDKVESLYSSKHSLLADSNEAELLNSYEPKSCPVCSSSIFIKYGRTKNGVIRYRCKKCGHTFTITEGTIFQDHKISISEWIEYCLCLFRFQSFNAISKTNRNAYSTTKYWLSKLFLILEDYQDNIVLKGNVYIDETFYKVRTGDIGYKDEKIQFRGLSKNQICIGIGKDESRIIAFVEGNGKTNKEKTLKAFGTHIEPGSKLIHDEEKSHKVLLEKLDLSSNTYNSKDVKRLSDEDNPLMPINRACFFLKRFLNSHSSFIRDDLQDYLNLFSFIMNECSEPYVGVEKLLNRALLFPKTLTYRDKFSN